MTAQAAPLPIAEFLADSIDPPPEKAVEASIQVLKGLGAITPAENITSLGRALSSFVAHPSISRMLLLGVLFRCIEPILILSPTEVTEQLIDSPHVSNVGLDQVLREFAAGSRSDQIALINAYREFDEVYESDDRQRIQTYVEQTHVRVHIYKEMRTRVEELYDNMTEMGLLPERPRVGRLWDTIPFDLNRNATNIPLVKALICSGLNPNISVWSQFAWRTKDGTPAILRPRSVASWTPRKGTLAMKQKHEAGDIVAFASKMKLMSNPLPWLWENTPSSHQTAILFSTKATIDRDMITLNDWLPLRVVVEGQFGDNADAAKVIMEFRKAVQRFLTMSFTDLRNISKLWWDDEEGLDDVSKVNVMFTHEHPVREAVVSGLVKVLEADAKAWEKRRDALDIPSVGTSIPAEEVQEDTSKRHSITRKISQTFIRKRGEPD